MMHHECDKATTMRLLAKNNIGFSKQICLPPSNLNSQESVVQDVFIAA